MQKEERRKKKNHLLLFFFNNHFPGKYMGVGRDEGGKNTRQVVFFLFENGKNYSVNKSIIAIVFIAYTKRKEV